MSDKIDTGDVLENARPAIEAMKEGRTQDYMLSAEGVVALWDALFQERAAGLAKNKHIRLLKERLSAKQNVLLDVRERVGGHLDAEIALGLSSPAPKEGGLT